MALAAAHVQLRVRKAPRQVAGVREGNQVIGLAVPEADRNAYVA